MKMDLLYFYNKSEWECTLFFEKILKGVLFLFTVFITVYLQTFNDHVICLIIVKYVCTIFKYVYIQQ